VELFTEAKYNVIVFGAFTDDTSKRIQDGLTIAYLGDVYIQKERVVIVKFSTNCGSRCRF